MTLAAFGLYVSDTFLGLGGVRKNRVLGQAEDLPRHWKQLIELRHSPGVAREEISSAKTPQEHKTAARRMGVPED
jgi:hypothetical protein